jgi:hypothetical protein
LKTPSHDAVQARLGYVALKPAAKPPVERPIDTMVAADSAVEDLPGELSAHTIQTSGGDRGLMTVFHVDIQQLRFTTESGERRQKLSLIAVLTDPGGNFVAGKEGTVTLALKDATFTGNASEGVNLPLRCRPAPGAYRLRAVMGEDLDGKIRARTLPVEMR